MATHSSILAWWIPWTEEPGGLQSTGSQRVGHDWATSLHFTSQFTGCLPITEQRENTIISISSPHHPFLFLIKEPRGWLGFPGGSEGKASTCNAGDLGSIPGSGKSPGEGNGNPLQYSWLENPMDRGAS